MNYPKNILIVRSDRIGDVVLSLPMAEIIKKHYPNCKVTYLVRSYTESLVKDHPFIDKVLVLKEKNQRIKFFSNIRQITANKFDYSIIVYPTILISLIIFFSGIKQRIGTGYRWYSFLFNMKNFTHRKFAEKHEIEFNIDLLKKLGIDENISKDNVTFNLQINAESKRFVDKVLFESGVDRSKKLIIVHPGSGGSAEDLPVLKYKELLNMFNSEPNVQIILTGSKFEFNLCEELKVNNSIKNFAGKFNLSELIALIGYCDVFISNSTGPLHIAAALGKYVIGFYPKILACSAKRWGPYSNNSLVFEPKLDCEDCTAQTCERLHCMDSIDIKSVFAEINNLNKFTVNNGEINE